MSNVDRNMYGRPLATLNYKVNHNPSEVGPISGLAELSGKFKFLQICYNQYFFNFIAYNLNENTQDAHENVE